MLAAPEICEGQIELAFNAQMLLTDHQLLPADDAYPGQQRVSAGPQIWYDAPDAHMILDMAANLRTITPDDYKKQKNVAEQAIKLILWQKNRR